MRSTPYGPVLQVLCTRRHADPQGRACQQNDWLVQEAIQHGPQPRHGMVCPCGIRSTLLPWVACVHVYTPAVGSLRPCLHTWQECSHHGSCYTVIGVVTFADLFLHVCARAHVCCVRRRACPTCVALRAVCLCERDTPKVDCLLLRACARKLPCGSRRGAPRRRYVYSSIVL